MNNIEILAPCGGIESVYAAVKSGADAVYLGEKEFSARMNAENFTAEQLEQVVKYCHIRAVKVYLALNTLIFDDETDSAAELVKTAAKCDIDAIIVQDIGLAQIIKKIVPDMPLHASTQMSIHTPHGAKALFEMGFRRVVLARELSKAEIKEIADLCPEIELEVFVHGALCMCMSGQCYLSAMIGTKSASRGMCAQPCRLPFSSDSSNKNALSLKDNSIVQYIDELFDIGVTSAKIEGRMKRPEYVSAAVRACKMMRDTHQISEEAKNNLEAVFSRGGFTDGYFTAHTGHDMFGVRRKEDVVSADEKLFRSIRAFYKDEPNKVALNFDFTAFADDFAMLKASDGNHEVTVLSQQKCEQAQNLPLSYERCAAALNKTGSTPFFADNISCNISQNISLPLSEINLMRRTAMEQISKKRERRNNYTINEDYKPKETQSPDTVAADAADLPYNNCSMGRRARFSDYQIPESYLPFEQIFVPLPFCKSDEDKIRELIEQGFNISVEVPRAMYSREQQIIESLKKAQALGVRGALCGNLASVYIAKMLSLRVHGDFSLNLTNTQSLLWAEQYGLTDVVLSFELDMKRICRLGASIPRGIISYGYLPLMLTRNCPVKSGTLSCNSCKKELSLQDRKGENFALFCDGHSTEILNCVPLLLPEKIYTKQNLNFTVLRLSVENSVENKEKVLGFLSKNQNSERFTHGLYLRGVKSFTIF